MSIIANILAKSNLQSFQQEIASRLVKRRKQEKISRRKLSEESGVSYSSLRRFEETGHISLESLLKICRRLGELNHFDTLFEESKYTSLKELRSKK